VAEIRDVFGSVGVYACVCESKSWPLLFFVLQRPHFELYPRPFWSQKYMTECRKSHLIFQNFLGRPPAGGRTFARIAPAPLYRPPFPRFLDPPLGWKAESTYSSWRRWFIRPNTVTHPSTNQARCWLTPLIGPYTTPPASGSWNLSAFLSDFDFHVTDKAGSASTLIRTVLYNYKTLLRHRSEQMI